MSWTTVVKRLGSFTIVMILAVVVARGGAMDLEGFILGSNGTAEYDGEVIVDRVEVYQEQTNAREALEFEGEATGSQEAARPERAAADGRDEAAFEDEATVTVSQETAESQTEPVGAREGAAVSSGDIDNRQGDDQTQHIERESSQIAQEANEVYEVVATGYYAGVESTGKSPGHPTYGITYSGVKVRRGAVSTIAADPRVFPIGTVLYIPGYGYGVVADIGGAVKGHVIDLYFQSKEDVYSQWGKKTVKVIVVEEGDGKLDEQKFQYLESIFGNKQPPPSAM